LNYSSDKNNIEFYLGAVDAIGVCLAGMNSDKINIIQQASKARVGKDDLDEI